jgi:O-glycosyl hydrolase
MKTTLSVCSIPARLNTHGTALLADCGGSSGGGAAGVTISSVEQHQRIAGFGVSEGSGRPRR